MHCHLYPGELLRAVYDDLVPLSEVIDITVEDPSDEFTALRDFVDCQNAQRLSAFRPPLVHRSYTEAAEVECRKKLKLQKVKLNKGFHIIKFLFLFVCFLIQLSFVTRSEKTDHFQLLFKIVLLGIRSYVNNTYVMYS